MNPLESRVKALETMLAMLITPERYTVQKNIQMFDGRNIQTGRTTGTIIATASDQKLGFHGATPTIRQAAITPPSGGATIDSQARTAIAAVITALQTKGITL